MDGLYGNYGETWLKHFPGYSQAELAVLPRVTTETGCGIDGAVTEDVQALNLLSMYLDQYKRGWSYTAVYLLRDRTDEPGNQRFGFYRPDYTPRKAALYLHNLTTILAGDGRSFAPGSLNYSIPNQPSTVHDLLLRKSDGEFELVVWDERIKAWDEVEVNLGRTFGRVVVYDPTVGASPVKELRNASLASLHLSNHPVILSLR